MNLEELRAAYQAACTRVSETLAVVDALNGESTADQVREASEANAAAVAIADQAKAALDAREAVERSRSQHVPAAVPAGGIPDDGLEVERTGVDPAIYARARGSAREELVYRPDQRNAEAKGAFHDLALASTGVTEARERLNRNNLQAIDACLNDPARHMRAGDLSTATHMGEFIPPDWTVELYQPFQRAGRPVADQCRNLGDPVSTVWSLPRVTGGATVAAQTEGSALSNTDHVSDSINAALVTSGGYSLASYQLMELADIGIDQIIFADLQGALDVDIDTAYLNSSTTDAKGLLQLSGTNSVTFTASTPTVPLLWPLLFQAKSQLEKSKTPGGLHFWAMHTSTWNWILAQMDANNRPYFLDTDGPQFNMLGQSHNGVIQGLAGNIDGIPVIVDQNIPVNTGAGTNQASIIGVNRTQLLVKEGAPRMKVGDQTDLKSLMFSFVLYAYRQQMFGRLATAFSKITGTGLVVQSGF